MTTVKPLDFLITCNLSQVQPPRSVHTPVLCKCTISSCLRPVYRPTFTVNPISPGIAISFFCESADGSRMSFSGLSGSTNQFKVKIIGAANNPCVSPSPDIGYNGTIMVTVLSIQEPNDDVKIDFSGLVPFPDFET